MPSAGMRWRYHARTLWPAKRIDRLDFVVPGRVLAKSSGALLQVRSLLDMRNAARSGALPSADASWQGTDLTVEEIDTNVTAVRQLGRPVLVVVNRDGARWRAEIA